MELFKALSEEEIQELKPYLVAESFKKKEEVFTEGEASTCAPGP